MDHSSPAEARIRQGNGKDKRCKVPPIRRPPGGNEFPRSRGTTTSSDYLLVVEESPLHATTYFTEGVGKSGNNLHGEGIF